MNSGKNLAVRFARGILDLVRSFRERLPWATQTITPKTTVSQPSTPSVGHHTVRHELKKSDTISIVSNTRHTQDTALLVTLTGP